MLPLRVGRNCWPSGQPGWTKMIAERAADTVLRIYPSLDAAQPTALPGEAHNPGPAG